MDVAAEPCLGEQPDAAGGDGVPRGSPAQALGPPEIGVVTRVCTGSK